MNGYLEAGRNIDEIVRQHEGLVRRVAQHVHGRVRSIVAYDDLLQTGLIGLIEAAQRYKRQEGVSFESYAVLRIRGAIYDFLRKNSNLNRSSIQMRQRSRAAYDRLVQKLRREPTQAELAAELGLSASEMAQLEDSLQAGHTTSLDEVYDEYSVAFTATDLTAEQKVDQDRLRESLVRALKALPPREAYVLQLYYVEGFNIYEVAATLELTPGRVSQLKSAAFRRMREMLQGELADYL